MSANTTLAGNVGNASMLSFWIGPVQPFIAAARSVRDLWTGSFLLSWLVGRAMGPVREHSGLESLVTPKAAGNPLLDPGGIQPSQGRLSACLPNRFLALIADDSEGSVAHDLAVRCEEACRAAWKRLCDRVHRQIDQEWIQGSDTGWDRLWQAQVANYFEIRTAVLPAVGRAEETLGRLLPFQSIDRSRDPWWKQLELAARVLEAQRIEGHLPAYPVTMGDVPQKCTLLGTYEQMGPANLEASREFWERLAGCHWGRARLRKRERLCAVSLVKRFAWPALFQQEFETSSDADYYPDTATVAAVEWLRRSTVENSFEIDSCRESRQSNWSGQWLHRISRVSPRGHPSDDQDEDPLPTPEQWERLQTKKTIDGPPPAYLAVLMLDGDHMGHWLRGERTPHAGREVNQAISESLAQFSMSIVPEVVREHDGFLIYSGGDDVLALLPTRQALKCARALAQQFQENWKRRVSNRLSIGEIAGCSAGIAVVHYKEDLRFALNQARQAERRAKDAGRDALAMAICRRSGEHASAVLPWKLVERLEGWVESFVKGASDRWLSSLRAESPALVGEGMPWEAVEAEVRRLAHRAEDEARRIDPDEAGGFLNGYREAMREDSRPHNQRDGAILDGFLTLAQSASFLARGRDR